MYQIITSGLKGAWGGVTDYVSRLTNINHLVDSLFVPIGFYVEISGDAFEVLSAEGTTQRFNMVTDRQLTFETATYVRSGVRCTRRAPKLTNLLVRSA